MGFYQLPHPWNPGYAIPDYVMAEPPERGTFTTQWLPRGTIPTLVPDFMAKPGKKLLGRAAADLGSLGDDSITGSVFDDDTLSAREYTLAPTPLGAARGPRGAAAVQAYGQQVAAHMIASVKRLPVQARAPMLKAAMDNLDPKLHAAATANANALVKKGVAPAAALQHGLAKAVVSGLAGELGRVGMFAAMAGSRRTSPANRLPGRGRMRGNAALGAITAATGPAGVSIAGSAGKAAASASVPNTFIGVGVLAFETTGMSQYGGFRSGDPWGGAYLQTTWDLEYQGPLPAALQAAILAPLSQDCSPCINTSMVDATTGHPFGRLRDFIPSLPARINGDFVRLDNQQLPGMPIIASTMPGVTNPGPDEQMNVFLNIVPRNTAKPWDSTTNPYVLLFTYTDSIVGSIADIFLGLIEFIAAIIVDTVKVVAGVVQGVLGLTCQVLTSPGVGGAAIATAAKAPSAASVAVIGGAAVAAAACPTPAPPPYTGIPPTSALSSLLPILLLGGGAIVVISVIRKRNRRAAAARAPAPGGAR